MVYSKKKRVHKKKTAHKKVYKKAPISKGANKLIPQVNSGPERKQLYGSLTDTRLNTTANINCLNPLGQGTTDGTRIGDKVSFKSLDIRMRTYCKIPTTIRLILFIDTKPRGSYPGVTDVLDSNDPQTGATGVLSHRNKVNLSRFIVLFDKWIAFNPPITGVIQEKQFHFYKRLNLGTDYSRGNANSYADIETNGVYMMGLSNNLNASDNPYYSFTLKWNYIDA